MTDPEDTPDIQIDPLVGDVEGPPDPNLDPARSPGVGADVDGLEDIDVSRDDIEIGEADPADLTAADTDPVADETVDSLIDDLANGSTRDRQRAAIALAEHDPDEKALEALVTSARSDPDADVRQFAVEAVTEMGGPSAGKVALAALGDEDPWVRAEAVVALDNLDRERFEDAIENCLDDDHHAIRRNALVSLWKIRGMEMVETIMSFVDDESDRVREWVATLLAEVDDERAESALRTLAADDHDIVAKTATKALDGDDPSTTDVGGNGGPATRSSEPEQSRHDRPPDL
jgi:hypothetical protein